MSQSKSRREFIGKFSAAGFAYYFGLPRISAGLDKFLPAAEDEDLFNWSNWENTGQTLSIPALRSGIPTWSLPVKTSDDTNGPKNMPHVLKVKLFVIFTSWTGSFWKIW